jgi:enoyl-CoA hydratase/carnithine racemase
MNGLAFGGGNELAMACTARIAKKGTKVLCGQPEPKLGLVPGYGGSQRLPRIIGQSAAWPILRLGDPISSKEALELGLIQEEVEGDIKEAGIVYVKKLISGEVSAPVIQKNPLEIPDQLPEVNIGFLSKKTDEIMQRVILEGAKMRLEEGLKHEAKILGELVLTKDMRIGMETFRKFGPKTDAGFSNA